jgi:hypothetical protein
MSAINQFKDLLPYHLQKGLKYYESILFSTGEKFGLPYSEEKINYGYLIKRQREHFEREGRRRG